jgi:hypothetical protein
MKRIITLIISGIVIGSAGAFAGTFRDVAPDGPANAAYHSAIDITPFTPVEATFGDSADWVTPGFPQESLAPVTPKEASFEEVGLDFGKEVKAGSGSERKTVIPHPDGFKPCDTHYGCGI